MDGREIVPVILCGGSGTRLWPRSRDSRPKPFLRLLGDQSLFEETLSRFSDVSQFAPPVIVTGAAHLDLVEGQSKASEVREIIVEPQGAGKRAILRLEAPRQALNCKAFSRARPEPFREMRCSRPAD